MTCPLLHYDTDVLDKSQTVLEMVNLTELPEELRAQTLPAPPPRPVCVITGELIPGHMSCRQRR